MWIRTFDPNSIYYFNRLLIQLTRTFNKKKKASGNQNQDSEQCSGKDWMKGSAFIVLSEMSWSAWLILQVTNSILNIDLYKYRYNTRTVKEQSAATWCVP